MKASAEMWDKIVEDLDLVNHDFDKEVFSISHKKIKDIVSTFSHIANNKKEIRNLGSQTTRESRPKFFIDNNLFLLPSTNTSWYFIKGDGYFDIPQIESDIPVKPAPSEVQFDTLTGDAEARFINEAFARSIIQDFCEDPNLKMTLMGRRYASFDFQAYNQNLKCSGIQIEIDAGYESLNQIVLVEAKALMPTNETIRQLFFPFKFISGLSKKSIRCIFLIVSKNKDYLVLYEYGFKDPNIYESIYKKNQIKYLL